MVTKNDVKKTKTYKGLTKIQQMLVLNWNNVKAINHGVELTKTMTFDEIEKNHNFSFTNLKIIKDLKNGL